ncbi:MAG: chloride channel protein [Planctomycetota bacterium]
MVGLIAGVGAVAFQLLGQAIAFGTVGIVAGYHPHEPVGEHDYFAAAAERPVELDELGVQLGILETGETAGEITARHDRSAFNPWLLIAVMAGGGLVSGVLVYTFAPEAEGHGTDGAIDSFHNRRGEIAARVPIVKLVASAITLGTGGSGGREGPIAQIGAGFGSVLATRLNLSSRDRRVLMAAGIGAGVGAIFRAPLAGALFAAEILYSDSDFESDVLVPAAIAAIVGYTVFTQTLPADVRYLPLFGGDLQHTPGSFLSFIPYSVLALILVFAGIAYIQTFYGTARLFKKVPLPPHLRPMLGATLAGLVGVGLFYGFGGNFSVLGVLGTGYGTLQDALGRVTEVGIPVLVTVAFAKMLTTGLTIGSGGSGGVFGPSMVIGGCLGGAVGLVANKLWPSVVTDPEAFAIVGMAGFFSGVARAPISTVIMVHELTGDYGLLPPTMLVSTLTFLLLKGQSLYVKQVPSRLESGAHRGDFIVDILGGLKVDSAYQKNRPVQTVHEADNLDSIVHKLAESHQHYYPVLDDEKRMVGIFSADDVRAYLFDETMWQLANARDVMVGDYVFVEPQDDLNHAMRRFTSFNIDELPVLEDGDRGKFLGFLRRKEVIAVYNRRLAEFKSRVDN